MNTKELNRKGKYMSLLLRHKPEKEDLNILKGGWVYVDELIKRLDITRNDLNYIVENDNKKRFSYNEDKIMIRANQGHSINIDLGLSKVKPFDVLYHGTATKNLKSIFKSGVNKMNRHHVHLSKDMETAVNVGSRHGNAYVLIINAKKMYDDGYVFYVSDNEVYLTENIPVEYIINK